jgi:hypothetical protein
MGGSSSETYSVGDRVSYSAGGSGAFVYNQAARTEQLGVNNSNGTVKFVSPDTNSIGIDFDSNFYSQTQDDNPDGWVNEDVFQLGGGTAPAPKFSDGDTIEVNTLAEICLSVRTFADADTSAIDCMPVGSRGSIKGTIRGPEDGHMWWEVNFDDMTIDGFSAEYYLDKVGGGTTPFVFSSGSFMVRGTFNVDMDLGVEGPAVADADFKWDIQSSTQRYLNPSPNVTMAVVPGTQVPDYNDCVNANLSSANIIGDDPNYSSMPVGTHICVKTNEDRYSTFTITDIDAATNHKLTISYTTWAKATDPPPVTAQCSDGLDNDSDGFVDTADPGCHSDGNAANAGSYNPNDDDETDLAGISFTKHIISTNVDSATGVYAIDLDGDGDNDVLSASYSDDTVAWYENDGSEGFTKHVITTSASSVRTVHAADIDGDGDIDVIAAVYDDDKIEWYENNGSENFTTHEVVTTSGSPMRDAFAIDVDGDGDIDIVSASINSDAIAWSENDGNQNFTRHVVTPFTSGGSSVHAIDVEGDGDVDILSALQFGNTIAWYENDGSQNFTSLNIDTNADGAISVHAVDVDSDGDIDVLAASHADHTVAWHENDGSQNFTKHSLNPSVGRSNYVSSVDIDGDGDIDILSSSAVGDTFEWYENDGSQVFANHVIDSSADGASSPFPIDLDGDGDIDIVAAMFLEDVVVWYEQTGGTQLPSPQCSDNIDNDGDGLIDSADPGCHTNLDAGNAGTYDGNDNDELNLKQTDLIKISGTPGTDNLRVRTGPFIPTTNPNSNVLETLNAGEVGTIVGGPSGPTNGFLWWQVDFLALASNGWVVQDFIELAPEAAADLAPGDTIIINPTNQDNGAPVYPAPVVDAATIIGYQSLAQATVTVDPITGEFFQFATPNSWHYLDFADDTIDGWVIDDFYRVDQIFPNQANNKSFEAISGGLPEGWTFESAECTGSVSSLNARLGNNSAMITCPATGGTGKFVQTFNGNAGSAYELIGFAKTVGTFGSPGADDVGASMTLEPAPQSEQRDNIQGEGDNGEHRILNNYVLASALGGADTIPMRLVLRFHSLPGPTESKAWFDDVQLIGGVFFGGTPEFSNGDRVEVAAGRVKVRSEGRYPTIFTIDDSDSDNVIAVLPAKTAGAIIDGPIQEVIDPDNFWWKVDFDNPDATDGWVEERALNVENTKTHYFSGTLTDAAPSATPSIQVNNTTGAIDAVLEWHPSVEGRSHNFRFMLYRPGVTPEPLQPSAAFDDDNNRHHPKRVKYILGSDPADAVGTWNFYIENNTGQSASEYTLSVTYPGVVDVNPSTQCSDGLDNDGDGTIDILDRGCHMDGDASNTVSYNPSDNTEFGEPLLPVDLVVTVLPMTSAHPQSTLGGGPNGFVVDGVEGKELTLERGGTYNFNVTTDGSHIFYLTHSQIGASIDPITAGVTGTGGGIGVSNGTLTFRPDENTPDEIYYGCSIHGRMGWQIHVVDPPIVSSGDISQDALANTLSGLETLLRELRKRINSL